jgi:hypothetical protein
VRLTSHRVDFVRGNRDYLRAADVLSAAPFETAPDTFQFFFRKIARHPGEWRKQINSPGADTAPTSAAFLALTFAQRKERWDFVIDNPGTTTVQSPDIDESLLLADIRLTSEELVCTLAGSFSLWDFTVAAARRGFFRDRQWHIAYIMGNHNCFPPVLEGLLLALRLGRGRSGFIEFDFDLANIPAGKLGVFPKINTLV